MKKNRTLRDMAVSSDVSQFANLPQQRGTLTKVTKQTKCFIADAAVRTFAPS